MATKRIGGGVKVSSALAGQPSVFKDSFRAVIKQELEKARYNPAEDRVLQEHKRKVKKILNRLYA